MYAVHFSPGMVKTLGEKSFVVFDTEERNEQKTGEKEKNTRDPKDLHRTGWGRIVTHGKRSGSKTEIVTDAPDSGYMILANELLSYGLVQLLLGQKSKDSSNGAVAGMKPLADFSVYTLAEYKGAKENKRKEKRRLEGEAP